MRKIVPLLGAVVVALTFFLVPIGSASAFGGEQLQCRVVSGPVVPAFEAGDCFPNNPSSSYSAAFEVFDGTGSYTYTWTVPAGVTDIGGCGSTDVGCAFDARAISADKQYTVSVVVQQSGQSETLSATADIPATCAFAGGWAFC
jgi:hypothetical protein